ncbi:MAG TPA: calcium/proton exchanger [Gaiellaceae bacterium]
MARKLLWGSLVLAPVTFVARYVFHLGDVGLFILAAASLVPLAWLIGEATEHAGEHTGPGVGGFLNATFGNAPELIIALFAISSNLPDVVRGSLTGSVVSNILLVLGLAMILGPDRARLGTRSLLTQLALVLVAVLVFLVPAVPALHGNPDRHSLALATIPVAIGLLGLYVVVTARNLRRHHAAPREEARTHAWSLSRALVTLGLATAVTALISEILVHSLDGFARAAGLSDFFIATVIVAIVGNAAEHGGAIVIARRGKMVLSSEIAISSSAQVAVFLIPAVALLSFLVKPALPLAFRPIELIGMGGAALLVALVVRDGRSRRWEGGLLITFYAAFVLWVYLVGDR